LKGHHPSSSVALDVVALLAFGITLALLDQWTLVFLVPLVSYDPSLNSLLDFGW
jgi:hypothetical protein